MRHLPILFSTKMVQAILAGEKTMTRREVGLKSPLDFHSTLSYDEQANMLYSCDIRIPDSETLVGKCRYSIGDTLWIKETFSKDAHGNTIYKADLSEEQAKALKWKSSLFMPKSESRIALKITDISVNRDVHNLNYEDCIAEGVEFLAKSMGECLSLDIRQRHKQLKEAWKQLWLSINGEDGWRKNPYVWAIKFQKIVT